MKQYYSSSAYIKLYSESGSVLRIIDLIHSITPGVIQNPDLYKYDYILKDTGNYSLPQELLNHGKGLSLLKQEGLPGASHSTVLDLSGVFLNQFDESEESYQSTGLVITSTGDDPYNNIYFYSLPGEVYFEVFGPSSDISDPYGVKEGTVETSLYPPVSLKRFESDKVEVSNLITFGIDIEDDSVWGLKTPILETSKTPYSNLLSTGSEVSEDLSKLTTDLFLESSNLDTPYSEVELDLIIHDRVLEGSNTLRVVDVVSTPSSEILRSSDYEPVSITYTDPF
jgi:hypothetical protein